MNTFGCVLTRLMSRWDGTLASLPEGKEVSNLLIVGLGRDVFDRHGVAHFERCIKLQ